MAFVPNKTRNKIKSPFYAVLSFVHVVIVFTHELHVNIKMEHELLEKIYF